MGLASTSDQRRIIPHVPPQDRERIGFGRDPKPPRSRSTLYGPRSYEASRWYHWENLRLWLAGILAIGLAGTLITDCTNGTTEHVTATVQDRRYHEAYWTTSLHTSGTGKNRTYYTTHDYHPAWWELIVQDWEGIEHITCSETYYYQVKPGQQVPVSFRRGRWTHWRWGNSFDND
jgi:hypothetical protein